jgi:hypothetical protein
MSDRSEVREQIAQRLQEFLGWEQGAYAVADEVMPFVDRLRSEITALESKLNDAFYERDAAIQERDGLQERLDSQGGAR